jgi:arabinogalactan oligomer/maltooligosaccharide transport system permease protein
MGANPVATALLVPERAADSPHQPLREPSFSLGRWFRATGWRHLIGIAALVVAMFPLIFVVSASLSTVATLTGSNALFSSMSLDSYKALFNDPLHPYGWWWLNSMWIGIVTAVLTVFLGALAAYAFSRFRFRGRRGGLLSLILVQMFPQMLAFVAIFLLLSGLQDVFPALGLGTRWGLIFVYLGGALGVNTYLLYGFFNTVPRDLDESAKIDGAGHAQIFFAIILRLVAPILAVIALLSFVGVLNDFLLASITLTDPKTQTLAVGLYALVSDQFNQNWGVFAAGAVLGAIPVVVLFQFLQRYIVGGLTAGAVKG